MTKEEAWLLWMKESKRYVEYDWDTIKRSSHWEAFSRGWDAAAINVNGWDDAYKMGMEAGKEMEKNEWQGLTEYEVGFLTVFDGLYDVEVPLLANFIRHIEAKLKEKNHAV
jgi:hypothetical protein